MSSTTPQCWHVTNGVWRSKNLIRRFSMINRDGIPLHTGYAQKDRRQESSMTGDMTHIGQSKQWSNTAQRVDRRSYHDRTWKPTQSISFGSAIDHSCTPMIRSTSISEACSAVSSVYPGSDASKPIDENKEIEPYNSIDTSGSADKEPESATKVSQSNESEAPANCSPAAEEPFRTPLGFHIPRAKLQNALDAAPESSSAYWQYTLYRGPGGDQDTVKVHYCKTKETAERISQLFLEEQVIGFDIEWKANVGVEEGIKKNVSLVQIASEERVALFHIARFPNAQNVEDFVPPSFKKIMKSSEITKVGVSIKGDCTRLKKFMGIDSRGLFELSHLYKLVKFSTEDVRKVNKILVSLASQVQEHFRLPLWKGDKVRSSDWSADLNYQQIQYAASDSYAGFHVYHVLEAKRMAMDPMPPRPAHAELNLPIKLADGKTAETTEEVSDTAEDQGEDAVAYPDISVEEILRDFPNFGIGHASSAGSEAQPAGQKTHGLDYTVPTVVTIPEPGTKAANVPPSLELSHANAWVERHNQSRDPQAVAGKTCAKAAELRAYALWHDQNLEVPAIAKLLRDPPLQSSTVVSYITKAVMIETLPYQVERIREIERYGIAYGVSNAKWERLKKGETVVSKE